MQIIRSGAGTPSVVICRPSGVTSGNVHTTLAGAAAAAKAFGPGALLLLDGNVTADLTTIDIDGLTIRGYGEPPSTITVNEGTIFNGATLTLANMSMTWTGSTPPFNIASFMVLNALAYVTFTATNASSNGLIYSPSADVYIDWGYACQMAGSSGHPVIRLGSGASCEINVKPTIPDIEGSIVTAIAANTLTGGDAGAYTITDASAGLTAGGGAATISHSQAGTNAPVFRP